MFGSDVLDVAIGVVVVYLLFALVTSTGQELVARMLKLRSRDLEDGIQMLIEGKKPVPGSDLSWVERTLRRFWWFFKRPDREPSALTSNVRGHRLMRGLGENPSYVGAPTFARALIATGANGDGGSSPQDVVNGLRRIEIDDGVSDSIAAALQPLVDEAKGDIDKFRASVEDWFDDGMTRVSGWYKRRAQLVLLVLGVAVAATFNVDSIQLVESLQTDPSVREALVELAPELLETAETDEAESTDAAGEETAAAVETPADAIDLLQTQLSTRTLPFGRWIDADPNVENPLEFPTDGWGWLYKVLGILIAAAAISLGAPFWFDALNKLVNLRGSGGKPATAAEARATNGGGDDATTAATVAAAITTAMNTAGVGTEAELRGPESVRSPNAMTEAEGEGLPTEGEVD